MNPIELMQVLGLMLFFGVLLTLTGVFLGLAWFYSPRYLWAAAATSWFVSAMGAWSIGGYLLVLTFILGAVALAYELRWRKPWQVIIAVLASIGLWAVAVRTVDGVWLFFPLLLLDPVLNALSS